MKKLLFLPALLFSLSLCAQNITLSLSEVVARAKERSADAAVAKAELETAQWERKVLQARFYPSLVLDATLPDFERSIRSVTLPTGEDAFVARSQVYNNLALSLNQELPATGGNFFIRSGISRLDVFGGFNSTNYLNQPFLIGYSQPLFAFNELKWERKLMPLRLQQAQRQYVESMEDVAERAVSLFFDLHLARLNHDIAAKNVANNDTLYKISSDRYSIGKIAQNELLQMELNLLNAQADLQSAELQVRQAEMEMKAFLDIPEEQEVVLLPPTTLPDININVEQALQQALAHSSRNMDIALQKLQNERLVAQGKAARMPDMELFLSFGLTQSTDTFTRLYDNVQDQESVNLGLRIPILGWGSNRAQYEIAIAQQKAVNATTTYDQRNFEQEVRLFAQRFRMMPNQVAIAAKADTIAQLQFEVAKNRYLIGKTSITDLNIAGQQKDFSKRNYWQILRTYWSSYYQLRELTLFDFEREKSLIEE